MKLNIFLAVIILSPIQFQNAWADPATAPSSTGSFYYYCQKLNDYYPRIPECPEGWIAVPVSAPPENSGQAIRMRPTYIPLPPSASEPDTSASEEHIRSHPTTASVEFFGKALLYSINVDHAFSDYFTLGVGAAFWDATIRWQSYHSTDWIFPVYGNFYFSTNAHRVFLTAGADFIHVSKPGFDTNTFLNNGAAGTVGAGYEYRDESGFVFRVTGILIIGRTVDVNPGINIGVAF